MSSIPNNYAKSITTVLVVLFLASCSVLKKQYSYCGNGLPYRTDGIFLTQHKSSGVIFNNYYWLGKEQLRLISRPNLTPDNALEAFLNDEFITDKDIEYRASAVRWSKGINNNHSLRIDKRGHIKKSAFFKVENNKIVETIDEKYFKQHQYNPHTVPKRITSLDGISGIQVAVKNNKYGITDNNGTPITPFLYENFKKLKFGYKAVQRAGLWTIFNSSGKAVTHAAITDINRLPELGHNLYAIKLMNESKYRLWHAETGYLSVTADQVLNFNQNLFTSCNHTNKGNKSCDVRKIDGNKAFKLSFDRLKSAVEEDRFIVVIGEQEVLINDKGEELSVRFDGTSLNFSTDYRYVSVRFKNGLFGLLDYWI